MRQRVRQARDGPRIGDREPLVERRGRNDHEFLREVHGLGDLSTKSFARLFQEKKISGWVALVFNLTCCVPALFGTAKIFVEKAETSKVARWSSQRCGVWLYQGPRGSDGASRAGIRERQKEARAGEYAVNCYENPNSVTGTDCNFFYQPTIPYTVTYSWDCPFNSTICADAQSVTFRTGSDETGLVDASVIGVNVPSPYKFRRNCTCAVLSSQYPFVTNESDSNSTTFYYNYGRYYHYDNRSWSDFTDYSKDNPFNWLAPDYRVT
jgi:hypothetical protein